jgi:hypothetical protein
MKLVDEDNYAKTKGLEAFWNVLGVQNSSISAVIFVAKLALIYNNNGLYLILLYYKKCMY